MDEQIEVEPQEEPQEHEFELPMPVANQINDATPPIVQEVRFANHSKCKELNKAVIFSLCNCIPTFPTRISPTSSVWWDLPPSARGLRTRAASSHWRGKTLTHSEMLGMILLKGLKSQTSQVHRWSAVFWRNSHEFKFICSCA